jgi:hypothetical protein
MACGRRLLFGWFGGLRGLPAAMFWQRSCIKACKIINHPVLLITKVSAELDNSYI